ncbi:MAG: extracellular solute-binding protein [Clostridia bacterium]|nr:extracellular solute-binding protein [Clostridia bacterium]
MKKIIKTVCALTSLCTAFGFAGCKSSMGGDKIRFTVWVSEGDRDFANATAKAFKEMNPDKNYDIVIDIEGENEIATRILNDVESAADVFSFPNDQIGKLINGDALAKIAGERLERVKQVNSEGAMDSATITVRGVEGVYGMPYTDNTFFLYYDKSKLTEEDVKSMDGILAKCNGNQKFAYPMSDGWYSTAFYFGKGLGYEVTYDDNLAEKTITCDFDNTTGVAVTQAMWGLAKDSRMKADANDSKITAGFNDGSVIAAVSGIWNKTTIQNYLGNNFAAAKLPTYTIHKGEANEEQVQLTAFAGYKLMGVNNYSKHKTDAMDFAEFYTNRENQLKHFDARGFVPTDETARQNEKVQADVCAKAITAQLQHSKVQKNVPSTLWVPMEGLGEAMITGAQSGTFDLTAQLKACVNSIKKGA